MPGRSISDEIAIEIIQDYLSLKFTAIGLGKKYGFSKPTILSVLKQTGAYRNLPISEEMLQSLSQIDIKELGDSLRDKKPVARINRAKVRGKKLGENFMKLLELGMSLREIGLKMGISKGRVISYIKRLNPDYFTTEKQRKKLKYNKFTKESVQNRSEQLYGKGRYGYDRTICNSSQDRIEIYCTECEEYFFKRAESHINDTNPQGCPKCSRIRGVEKISNSLETVIMQFRECHGYYYDYSKVICPKSNSKEIIICPKHGDFIQSVRDHKRGKGCPRCSNRSKGESKLEKLLKSRNIQYTPQKTFEKCRNKKLLRFDFFLPEQNILIEYHGKQHCEPIEFFGGWDKFLIRLKCDQLKRDWCQRSPFQLYEIYYDEDMEALLEEILQE